MFGVIKPLLWEVKLIHLYVMIKVLINEKVVLNRFQKYQIWRIEKIFRWRKISKRMW